MSEGIELVGPSISADISTHWHITITWTPVPELTTGNTSASGDAGDCGAFILRSPRTRCVPYPARQRRRAVLMSQFIQILGAVLVLIAYIAGQLRLLDGKSYPYLVLNLLGSGLLAVLAAAGSQWGFLLLEGTWALVSLLSLGARLFSAGST